MSHVFILGLLTLGVASCREAGSTHAVDGTTVAISTVSKFDQAPFFARIPTPLDRIVVTSPSVKNTGTVVKVSPDESLYFVELRGEPSRRLSSEIFHHDIVSIFSARDEREAFILASAVDPLAHPHKINTVTLNDPLAETLGFRIDQTLDQKAPEGQITIDPDRMRQDLESLSGARPIVLDGKEFTIANRASNDNKLLARKWLQGSFENLGYKVTEHRYNSGTNLIAERLAANPIDERVIMVTAHLDTVQTAGADDDGSGIISGLAIARALKATELRHHIRFVAFDEEERGLVGSAAYAKRLAELGEIQNVSVINLEMTGYDSDDDGDFHTIDCNENTSGDLSRVLLSAIASEGITLNKIDACTTRSDHAVFWNYNRPAIVISQNFFGGDGNPCYHRTCDNVSKVNFGYMTKITQAAANAVHYLAGH